MTPSASRKASERQRRKERGEVALSGWLSAEDHVALTDMAREAGMTQAQVISKLIGMRAAVLGLERWDVDGPGEALRYSDHPDLLGGKWVRHSDLTAAVGLMK